MRIMMVVEVIGTDTDKLDRQEVLESLKAVETDNYHTNTHQFSVKVVQVQEIEDNPSGQVSGIVDCGI